MPDAPMQKIIGFSQDEEGHWRVDLACGHRRHVRHMPPWQNREWVLTEQGREAMIGEVIECGLCAQAIASRNVAAITDGNA